MSGVRGSGRTLEGLKQAHKDGAYFIVHSSSVMDYTTRLARAHGLDGVGIKTLTWVENQAYRGTDIPLIFDHHAFDQIDGNPLLMIALENVETHNARCAMKKLAHTAT